MRKPVLQLTAFIFFINYLSAQNSMVGDGFGGRGWYVPHNYQVGAYSAYTVCGDSNQLYGWGSNKMGELGDGTFISSNTSVKAIGMTNIKFYTTGYTSAAIKNDSTVWVWGNGSNSSPISGFTLIPQYLLSNVKFADGGTNHIVFVKYDGTVWGAGQNTAGQLGNGTTSNVNNPVLLPVQMAGVNNAVRAIAVGCDGWSTIPASIISLADGSVKITGGYGTFTETNNFVPVTVSALTNIVDIKGGVCNAYALNNIGEVYSFGLSVNASGVPNPGNTLHYVPPTKISFPTGAHPIIALSANNDGGTAMALDDNGNVYSWGNNYWGQMGVNSIFEAYSPVLIASNAIDIYAGETFCYILKSDNTLWASGTSSRDNTYGSIWMNLPNIQRNVFTQINPTIAPMNLCAPKYGVLCQLNY